MKLDSKKLAEITKYNATDFNNFVMSLKSTKSLEKILVHMLTHSHLTRVLRVHSRYNILRKREEVKLLRKGKWNA